MNRELQAQFEAETNRQPEHHSGAIWETPEYLKAYAEWLEARPQSYWSDNKVMEFVNWHLEVKGLDPRYEIENQFLIDSFRKGDVAKDWHGTLLPQQPEVSEDLDKEIELYCPNCGEMENLAYLDQYANGEEYRCQICRHTFIR